MCFTMAVRSSLAAPLWIARLNTSQAAELIHHVGVNARLQVHEALKALRYGGRVTQHLLGE